MTINHRFKIFSWIFDCYSYFDDAVPLMLKLRLSDFLPRMVLHMRVTIFFFRGLHKATQVYSRIVFCYAVHLSFDCSQYFRTYQWKRFSVYGTYYIAQYQTRVIIANNLLQQDSLFFNNNRQFSADVTSSCLQSIRWMHNLFLSRF